MQRGGTHDFSIALAVSAACFIGQLTLGIHISKLYIPRTAIYIYKILVYLTALACIGSSTVAVLYSRRGRGTVRVHLAEVVPHALLLFATVAGCWRASPSFPLVPSAPFDQQSVCPSSRLSLSPYVFLGARSRPGVNNKTIKTSPYAAVETTRSGEILHGPTRPRVVMLGPYRRSCSRFPRRKSDFGVGWR